MVQLPSSVAIWIRGHAEPIHSHRGDRHRSFPAWLVGSFNPFETYARQIGSFPQG